MFDMLKKMPYLDGVIFETFRLFPAGNYDTREAARDDILPNGVRVPKGTHIDYEFA